MKKVFLLTLAAAFVLGTVAFSFAGDDSALIAKEKEVWKKACDAIPADHLLDVAQFKALYDKVVAGKEKAYLIDVRTYPEFYAFHIPYTDHIHAGHMYTIVKKIKDPNAKIVVWCRTHKRQCYVAQKLIEYGYKNVWAFKDGIVGWVKAGNPVCNQYAGIFKITEYHKRFLEKNKDGKFMWNIREFEVPCK